MVELNSHKPTATCSISCLRLGYLRVLDGGGLSWDERDVAVIAFVIYYVSGRGFCSTQLNTLNLFIEYYKSIYSFVNYLQGETIG